MNKYIEEPNGEDILWRYMDLSKLISLFDKEELFFSAADRFEDPFEGAIGYKKDKEKLNKSLIESLKKSPSLEPHLNFETPEGKKLASTLISYYGNHGLKRRTDTFINCWHLSDVESEAMWKIYSNDITNAVAIQTTYQKLKDVLQKYKLISIGKVNYIDYNDIPEPYAGRFFYKRKSFSYENEVRAITRNQRIMGLPGMGVHVNLDVLIERIYVSPYAPVWFTDVVKSVLDRYEINKEIVKSKMLDEPWF